MTGWQAGENALVGLQLTFSFGQWATWLTLLNGGTLHLRGRFDPGEVSDMLASGTIDRFPVVPTMLRVLLDSGGAPEFGGHILAGGEPLPATLGLQVRGAFPEAGLGDIYGLTETGTSDFFVHPQDYDRYAGTIGHAGEGIEWQLDRENGELQIRSSWRMQGYLDAPDLTEDAFVGDWFRTGDLAERDDSGALRLVGRIKDLILRAGNKIAPLEVEAVFLDHAGIANALATGVEDPERGQATHLAVVPRKGEKLVREELRTWAADYLERYKIPDVIHVVEHLPTGGTGKVDRQALRRLIEEGLLT
jgi:acyl-CoA synthetase (AMP-forming)/AMP-acid ligase II